MSSAQTNKKILLSLAGICHPICLANGAVHCSSIGDLHVNRQSLCRVCTAFPWPLSAGLGFWAGCEERYHQVWSGPSQFCGEGKALAITQGVTSRVSFCSHERNWRVRMLALFRLFLDCVRRFPSHMEFARFCRLVADACEADRGERFPGLYARPEHHTVFDHV